MFDRVLMYPIITQTTVNFLENSSILLKNDTELFKNSYTFRYILK